MRDIIELCVDLDTSAVVTYSRFASISKDPEIQDLFRQMGKEEKTHVGWWTDLLDAWDAGLVPPVCDEDALRASLKQLASDVREAVPADCSDLTTDEMLSVAAHVEFYMLDPAFAELIDLVRPSKEVDVREAYSQHIMRLVEAIEGRHTRSELSHFLARALARTMRDQQRLGKLATKDSLTDLYNRRGFYGYVRHWVSYATRYGHPLSVLLVDIDRFKSINDRYGHLAGDEALKVVAAALRGAVRTSDLVGRYGGDEFSILAPDTDAEELAGLMERVLSAIREMRVDVGRESVQVTVSIGGSFVTGGFPVTPEQLLAAADQGLYEAKAAGRNGAAAPRNASGV